MMTEPKQPSTKRRSSGTSAATRITTAGLAVAVTLGLGSAVAARAAEQKRADAKKASATTGDDATQESIQSELAAATAKIKDDERARYDKQAKALRDKYQKSLDKLAAEYSAKLGGGSTGGSSSSGSSGGGSYSSSSSGGGGSSASKVSGGSSASKGSSSSSGGGGSASAPKAPSTSKGS